MPPYKAGQYLSFNFKKGTIDGVTDHDVKRNWSISCGENQETFRISLKKEDKGLVSTHMHENVKIGDVLEVISRKKCLTCAQCGNFSNFLQLNSILF